MRAPLDALVRDQRGRASRSPGVWGPNLPAGTKAALKARAAQHRRSAEAEAWEILADALEREPVTLVDLLSTEEGADIEFAPERLGLTARTPEL